MWYYCMVLLKKYEMDSSGNLQWNFTVNSFKNIFCPNITCSNGLRVKYYQGKNMHKSPYN